jgi:CHASE2 domain-containing sensor protein
VTPERRRAALRVALVTSAAASGVAVLCAIAAFESIWFVVIGTGACAVLAGAAFYGAYEGFDERLRRGP